MTELKNMQKKVVRIISVSKYNAHTESLINSLKNRHILKLQELKISYKFTHNKLPVYLQHLSFDQNSSIENIDIHGQYNIHTVRVQHEFAKHSLMYTLPHTIKMHLMY